MFITLTDADNSKAVIIRADQVVAIRVLDEVTSQVLTPAGAVEVKQSPVKIALEIERVLGFTSPNLAPAARSYQGGW